MYTEEAIMTMPRLSTDEYSDIVDAHNRRMRGGMAPRCMKHEYARTPWDTDEAPEFVCVHCMHRYMPDMAKVTVKSGKKKWSQEDPRSVSLPNRNKRPL